MEKAKKRYHKKSEETIHYERKTFLDFLNGPFPKSMNLKRALEVLIQLASENLSPKEAEKLRQELNQRIFYYAVGLEFGPGLQPEWVGTTLPNAPDFGGIAEFDHVAVAQFPGLISSGDFKRLAFCQGPGCHRVIIKNRDAQRFCNNRCRERAFKSTHREEHREYMRNLRRLKKSGKVK